MTGRFIKFIYKRQNIGKSLHQGALAETKNPAKWKHSFYKTLGNSLKIIVPYRHGGGWSKKINAWYLNTLMVYL
jgi:hypothetical protein